MLWEASGGIKNYGELKGSGSEIETLDIASCSNNQLQSIFDIAERACKESDITWSGPITDTCRLAPFMVLEIIRLRNELGRLSNEQKKESHGHEPVSHLHYIPYAER